MSKQNLIRDFNWLLEKGLSHRLVYEGDHNLFLIDTGVFIDIEQAYHNGKIQKRPAYLLEKIAFQYPLIITPRVMEEIERHAACRLNRNRYEISESTLVLARELYNSESQEFLRNSRFNLLDIGNYALQVYYASIEAFKDDFRKGEKECISYSDREMITSALLLSKSRYGDSQEDVRFVNILSPDEHIPRTIHVLKTLPNFSDCRVRAIPTRHDLRSYLT